MTNWNKAFDKVLREFSLSAKWLSQVSGVSEHTISQFRKGHKDATTATLSRLLAPLPEEARERFFSLVQGTPALPAEPPSILKQAKKLPREARKKLIIELVELTA